MTNDVDIKGAKRCIDGGAIVLDVRTEEEFKEGHIKGSTNIDFHSADFNEQVEKLDKSRSYVVYCVSGGRSAKAEQVMLDMGFEDVHSMVGGITEWKNKGFPVVE